MRCALAIMGGGIVGLGAGIATGVPLASYLMPGPPTPTGLLIVIGSSALWTFGGVLVNSVQFCGR